MIDEAFDNFYRLVHSFTFEEQPDDDLQSWFIKCFEKLQNGEAKTLDEAFGFNALTDKDVKALRYRYQAYKNVVKLRDKGAKTSNQEVGTTFAEASKDLPISAKDCAKYYRQIKKKLQD